MAKLINDLVNSELYKQEPPRFGREVREQCFVFTPGCINLNNGSFGATPLPVSGAQILVDVRNEVAEFICANADEVVLVPNAPTGVNTVLRNFTWEKDNTLVSQHHVQFYGQDGSIPDRRLAISVAEADQDTVPDDSNGYKWLTAKRSVTFLYVPRRNQYIIKSSVPTSGSYVSAPEQNSLAQFQWNGVVDYANYFSVSSEIFNTEVMDPDGSFTWNMVNVERPGWCRTIIDH
ncbi:hypothetical protein C0995_002467 [Termitomyces sp. Mi166|nr:hypothetical protein C0995_002467 [Termitomyces sp. Mi166\